MDELSGKLKEKLESNRDIAFFSKQLATILCDFENTLPQRFEYKGPDYASPWPRF
ncbi:MAG: hypothetical protein MZU97_17575 [Bacillus subtilis]|nr:hypothetical protein [Bacillus subtilis]